MSNELPRDLIDRGFVLIVLKNSQRLMAVSKQLGGSLASHDLAIVIRSARAMASWCAWQNKRNSHDNI